MWLPGFERPIEVSKRKVDAAIGVFFTPAALARTLSEESILSLGDLTMPEITIFDPACGSGELLREAFRLIRLKKYQGRIRLIGWDISPIASQMARFILHWERRSWTMYEHNIEIETKDSLVAPQWPDHIDLLIMNPPFLAWTRMSNNQQSAAQEILGDMQVNRPNLAMLFSARGIKALKDGGVVASIVPNSFLEAQSSSPLRRQISEQATVELIARLGSQNVFSDALVDAGFYIAKKHQAESSGTVVLWSDSQPASYSRALRALRKTHDLPGTRTISDPVSSDEYSIYVRKDAAKSSAPWKAREFMAWRFFSRLGESRKTIPAKKLFEINQGVRMGDDLFIVPKEYVQGLDVRERDFFRPAVMNPSLLNGRLLDSHYIFYPNTIGLPIIQTDNDLPRLVPRFFADVLNPNEDRLRARKSLHDKERWWGLSEPRRWLENQTPRIISKYFGRERPFAFDREGKFVVVVGHSWNIRSGAVPVEALTSDEVYLIMSAFLNSSVFTALASYTSVQVSGGQMDLSNRYVDSIPLPNPTKLADKILHRLVEVGEHIQTSEVVDWKYVDEAVSSVVLAL
jgi:SAM-dependent methyltransferase